jgi:hypothetical protein
MAFKAVHRYARISSRKVRPLADLVRGKFADEALELLQFQPHRGARMLEKVIKSAVGLCSSDFDRCREARRSQFSSERATFR